MRSLGIMGGLGLAAAAGLASIRVTDDLPEAAPWGRTSTPPPHPRTQKCKRPSCNITKVERNVLHKMKMVRKGRKASS